MVSTSSSHSGTKAVLRAKITVTLDYTQQIGRDKRQGELTRGLQSLT